MHRLLTRHAPDVAAVIALAVLGMALWVSVTGALDQRCDESPIACGFGQNLVSALAVALLGFYALFGRKRDRVVRHYRRLALRHPERIAPTTFGELSAGLWVSRRDLVDDVLRELTERRERVPIVIHGEAGAGKSVVLVQLAQQLAAQRKIPVLLSLRNQSDALDLEALACRRFAALVDSQLTTADQSDQLWRRLRQEGLLVLLVDGLDESLPNHTRAERDVELRLALQQAVAQGLPVVATVRTSELPSGTGHLPVALPPLERDEAVDAVAAAWRLRGGQAGDRSYLGELFDDVELRLPLYLRVLAEVGAQVPFPQEADQPEKRRFEILAAYCRARDVPGRELGQLAIAMLHANRLVARISELETLANAAGLADAADVIDAAGDGIAAGVLQRVGSDGVRFQHAIFQAFFAACAIQGDPQLWTRVLATGADDATLLALTMFAGCPTLASEDAVAVADALVRATPTRRRELMPLIAAVEVCRLASSRDCLTRVAAEMETRWTVARPQERRAAVAALARTSGPAATQELWRIALRDDHFLPRWEACVALTRRTAQEVVAVVAPDVTAALGDAGDSALLDERRTRTLGVAAFVIPSLALGHDSAAATAGEWLNRLQRIAGTRANPLRLDVSIARGLRLAVMQQDADGQLSGFIADALALRPRMWLARLSLLQSLTVQGCRHPSEQIATTQRAYAHDPAEHPLVRATAELGLEACERGGEAWRRVVWESDSQVVSGRAELLTPRAAQLAADVALLTNLVYATGAHAVARNDEALELAAVTSLPRSLTTPEGRHAMIDRASAQRSLPKLVISEAFCRQQHRLALRHTPPWLGGLGGRDLARFWRSAERAISQPVGGEL